ncbi:unnamed protein product [Lactuca virosa]|uniref:Uncharacterized protein n=1 Tax=Lactuca virosa TaxID=75947 RepID=A0AAU9PKG1_9ASTR|nr:unnamed protein product [Lactuca virosa]
MKKTIAIGKINFMWVEVVFYVLEVYKNTQRMRYISLFQRIESKMTDITAELNEITPIKDETDAHIKESEQYMHHCIRRMDSLPDRHPEKETLIERYTDAYVMKKMKKLYLPDKEKLTNKALNLMKVKNVCDRIIGLPNGPTVQPISSFQILCYTRISRWRKIKYNIDFNITIFGI